MENAPFIRSLQSKLLISYIIRNRGIIAPQIVEYNQQIFDWKFIYIEGSLYIFKFISFMEYDILSFRANGQELRRKLWQIIV